VKDNCRSFFFVDDAKEVLVDFALHQVEKDLGGMRPAVTEFFPFPLLAGPFEAGCAMGVNRDAIPNVHLAFTSVGMMGRCWNPALSREDNAALEYTGLAEDIFVRCGVPVPERCPRRTPAQATSVQVSEEEAAPVVESELSIGSAPEMVTKNGSTKDTCEGSSKESTCMDEASDGLGSACDSKLGDKELRLVGKLAEKPLVDVLEVLGQTRSQSGGAAPAPELEDAEVKPKARGFFCCLANCKCKL